MLSDYPQVACPASNYDVAFFCVNTRLVGIMDFVSRTHVTSVVLFLYSADYTEQLT